MISSNVGGLPEVNIEGQSGFLFDVGDTQNMAKKSIELLKDQVQLEALKEQAKKSLSVLILTL